MGVGGALVIGSELFTGSHGHAGELGHVVVQSEGAKCSCGGRGCVEIVAGQDAIFAAAGIIQVNRGPSRKSSANDFPAQYPSSDQSRSDSMAQLKSALTTGDAAALTAVTRAGYYLGVAMASTVRLFNISSVVLGGHFATLGEWIKPALSDSLATFAPGMVPPGNISLSALDQTGALMGAAASVIRSLLEAPHRIPTNPPPHSAGNLPAQTADVGGKMRRAEGWADCKTCGVEHPLQIARRRESCQGCYLHEHDTRRKYGRIEVTVAA